jgi:hypothetical protein
MLPLPRAAAGRGRRFFWRGGWGRGPSSGARPGGWALPPNRPFQGETAEPFSPCRAHLPRPCKPQTSPACKRPHALNPPKVIAREGVTATPEGLEAVVFTADGDMRQALNNLQATYTGFGDITPDNVFRVGGAPRARFGGGRRSAWRAFDRSNIGAAPAGHAGPPLRVRFAWASRSGRTPEPRPLLPSKRASLVRCMASGHLTAPSSTPRTLPTPPLRRPRAPPQVCDQPHPTLIREVLQYCVAGRLEQAYAGMRALCDQGYSAMDVITILFRVRLPRGAGPGPVLAPGALGAGRPDGWPAGPHPAARPATAATNASPSLTRRRPRPPSRCAATPPLAPPLRSTCSSSF